MKKYIALYLFKLLVCIPLILLFTTHMITRFEPVDGIHLVILIWTFIILCTPVTKGGVLIDGPMYLVFGKTWAFTEIILWLVALIINLVTIDTRPGLYVNTFITHFLYHILMNPWPFWLVLGACALSMLYNTIHVRDPQRVSLVAFAMGMLLRISAIVLLFMVSYPDMIVILNTHGLP